MVAIRLRREGTKNTPYYKVVVTDQRSPRDGKFIEIIGNYDPKKKDLNANIDLARADYWIGQGAKRVLITVERGLLADADKAARSRKVSRSELIALGLRMAIRGTKKIA